MRRSAFHSCDQETVKFSLFFSAERIDIATMQMLNKQDIHSMFPQIGDRLRFEAALAMLKSDQPKDMVCFHVKFYLKKVNFVLNFLLTHALRHLNAHSPTCM